MFTVEPTNPSVVSTVSPAWIPAPAWIGSAGPPAVSVAAATIARPQRTAALAESTKT